MFYPIGNSKHLKLKYNYLNINRYYLELLYAAQDSNLIQVFTNFIDYCIGINPADNFNSLFW